MKLIGLIGKARVGKDTVALRLCEKHNFYQYAFATPMKDMLTVAFGNHFHHGDREKPLAWLGKSPRQLMQTLGTEWGRDLVHPDLWTLLAEREVKAAQWIDADMVISDVRFHNEADMILRHGGELWHILRDDAEPAAPHSSEEYDWSGYTQRRIIHNNGAIDELHAVVDALL